jgi:hypothetical protein
MNTEHRGWLHLVREIQALLAVASKVEARDPEGATIMRFWAAEKALLICDPAPGTLDVALRALISSRYGPQFTPGIFSKNRTRLGRKPSNFSGDL